MSSSTNKTRRPTFAGSTSGRGVAVSKRVGAPPSVESSSRMRQTKYGGASRTLLSSTSKKNVTAGSSDKGQQGLNKPPSVLDENGHDVTPVTLHADPNAVRKNQSNILADSSAATPTDLMSQASIYHTGTVGASTFAGGPFTRSVFSASQSGRSTTGSISDDLGEGTTDYSWSDIKHKREEVKEELTEGDLEKTVDINLTETETIWLLDMPDVSVCVENEEAEEVRARNARYQEMLKNKIGNDRYMERGMNTFNEPPKFKSVQTSKVISSDVGVDASNWDMYDTYENVKAMESKAAAEEKEKIEEEGTVSRPVSVAQVSEKGDVEKDGDKLGSSLIRDDTKTSMQRSGSRGTNVSSMAGTDSVFASKDSGVTAVQEVDPSAAEEILNNENLKLDMVFMERVVNLNTYQAKQACYRGLGVLQDVDRVEAEEETTTNTTATAKQAKTGPIVIADMGPNLDRLWAYQCALTKGRNVSCIAWNKQNPDLLAVGYGQFEFTGQKGGLVCCWSLKNPEFPERVYTSTAGVTSIDFSQAHQNLLAVGLYDGTIAIYNVRSTVNEPILDSFESNGKHTDPVWELKWIEKERGSGEERAEILVSISTDGRVTQWSIRKGFESYDLMRLKRLPSKLAHVSKGKEKKAEAFIARHAGGLCFDFSAKDTNIYLAGSEEGYIHKCSCSYNEQYLDTYNGHNGPVYKIHWSPFVSDAFLSCSGDWSIKLWHQDRSNPVLSFHSSTKAVHDICWSPRSSTVFACVNEGAVEVWDLSQNTLDPIIVNNPMPGVKLSSVSFAKNSECILVGDSEGQLSVYQLKSMPASPEKQEEALAKIMQSSLASQLQPK